MKSPKDHLLSIEMKSESTLLFQFQYVPSTYLLTCGMSYINNFLKLFMLQTTTDGKKTFEFGLCL